MAPLKNLLGNMTGRRGRSLANMDPTMMMMAAQLINNSAPSTQRRSLMQGMPEALMRGQQMDRQNKEYERQQAELARQQKYSAMVAAAVNHDPGQRPIGLMPPLGRVPHGLNQRLYLAHRPVACSKALPVTHPSL